MRTRHSQPETNPPDGSLQKANQTERPSVSQGNSIIPHSMMVKVKDSRHSQLGLWCFVCVPLGKLLNFSEAQLPLL
jgi:hypothetical protein